MKKYRKDLIYVGIIFLLVIGFFYQTFIFGKLPVPTDSLVGLYHPWRDYYSEQYPRGIPFKNFLITDPVRQQIPWRKLVIDEFKAGKIPLWNPFNFSGTQLSGNIQAGAFYPFNLIFFVLSFPAGWSVLIILEPLLAGIFLYIYLRSLNLAPAASLFGALAWSYSGYNVSWLTWGTITHVSLWLPLMLLSLDKIIMRTSGLFRWMALLILSGSFAFFAGHAQVALYIYLLSFIYAIWKVIPKFNLKNIFILLVSTVMVLVFTSVQWVPFLGVVLSSSRIDEAANWLKSGWFLPWEHLTQFVAPDFFGNPTTLNYWGVWNYGELTGYIGLIPLIFSLFALFHLKDRKVFFWLGVIIFSLLFMLPTPIAAIPFIYRIPVISSLQPTRLMVLLDFSLVMLASYGISYWLTERDKRRLAVFIGMSVLFILLWILVVFPKLFTSDTTIINNLITSKRNLLLPTIIIFLGSICIGIFEYFRKHQKAGQAIVVGIFILTVFDLFRFGWKFTPFNDMKYFFPVTPALKFLQSQAKPFRIMSLDKRILPPNTASYYGIESVDGYDPIFSNRYEELAASSERSRPNIKPPFGFDRILTLENIKSPILSLFNARYVLSLADIVGPNFHKVFQEGETRIYENKRSFDRAYFVENVITEYDNNKIIQLLFDYILFTKYVIIYNHRRHSWINIWHYKI